MILHLTKNMCIQGDTANQDFAIWIQKLLCDPALYGSLQLLSFIGQVELVEMIFDQMYLLSLLQQALHNSIPFKGCSILAFHNDIVLDFNNLIIQSFPDDIQIFTSVDSADINEQSETEEHELLAEFLQRFNSAYLPPSKLKVKIGAPVILLQNLDPKASLCNRIWMTITQLNRCTMEVQILAE